MTTARTGFVFLLLTIAVWPPPSAPAAEPTSDVKVWPIFYRASDPVTSRARTEVFWPFYVRESTSRYTANQILSFRQRYPRQYPKQFYLLWPLIGVRAGHGHDAWLFPILWSGADAGGRERHHALFPLVYYGAKGKGRTLNILLLQHNQWDRSSRLHALWPLFWLFDNRPDGEVWCGALPLFWVARHQVDKPDRSSRANSGGVLLLNWWYRSKSESRGGDGTVRKNSDVSDGLLPVFCRWRSNREKTSPGANTSHHEDGCWVIPYWQSHDTSITTKSGAAPKRTAESRHVLFPFWWDWRGEKRGRIDSGCLLFPCWWRSAERREGELAKSTSFLVPIGAHFYKKGEYETQNLFGPVLNRTESLRKGYVRYDAFFPLLSMTNGVDRSGGRLFPLAGWEGRRSKYSNLWCLFPLGWRCESQEAREYRVSSPRFWALHEMESRPFTNEADCPWAGPRRTVAFLPFFWSRRRADVQNFGVLPFWWTGTYRSGRNVHTDTCLPLLLGRHTVNARDDKRTHARRDYLFSILAWGKGQDYRLRRFFPIFSYARWRGSRDISSLLLPFSYHRWRDRERPELRHGFRLSVPFSFLPWYGSRNSQRGASTVNRKSWFFPFWEASVERSPERDVERLSILWPAWNRERENGETRIRGFGGVVNLYEEDVNGFVEQRILYRLFTRHTRSWFSEHELMPFYARQSREDGVSYWKLLGGLLGSETRGGRSYLRLLYIPIPTGRARKPDAAALKKRQAEHADLALKYLRHHRHDRAAIEFALAGSARAEDRDFQIAAGEAHLAAKPDAISKELRSSIPSSLERLGGKSGFFDTREVRQSLRNLAIRHFERAIALGGDKPRLLRRIARACSDINQHGLALKVLVESDQLCPCFATAMARSRTLARLEAVWALDSDASEGHGASDENRRKQYRDQRQQLLTELHGRYPNSPSLALLDVEMLRDERHPRPHWGALSSMPKSSAFASVTQQKLTLYERGAEMRPGPEERAWLQERPSARMRACYEILGTLGHWEPATRYRTCPWRICAAHAITILARQAWLLMDEKKARKAEALFPRIRKLLPHLCDASAESDRAEDPFGCVRAAIRGLYRLEVEAKDEPETYIGTAREWAAALCTRRQKAVERLLEAVLFEQQYLKRWSLSPVAGCDFEAKSYRGKFFNRYVDLDAILGQPDNCTVTAECVLVCPDERNAVLRLGFDHTLKAELNGETVMREHSRKIAVRDEFAVPITLRKGENRLKLTVTDNTLGYGFFARLSDENGDLMEDVRY